MVDLASRMADLAIESHDQLDLTDRLSRLPGDLRGRAPVAASAQTSAWRWTSSVSPGDPARCFLGQVGDGDQRRASRVRWIAIGRAGPDETVTEGNLGAWVTI